MKTAQYVRQEKTIAAGTVNDVRQRWLWGLRLLRDTEAMSESGKSLRNGVTDQLIAAAKAAGLRLSPREIQYRLQAARVYATESQIANACAEFEDWTALKIANFPPFAAAEGEAPADHRTDDERKRDHARAIAALMGEQGSLFPLSDFEPTVTTLKDLAVYTEEMEELTARFAKRDRERRSYLDSLIAVADDDMSMTWQAAHDLLGPDAGELPQVGPPT